MQFLSKIHVSYVFWVQFFFLKGRVYFQDQVYFAEVISAIYKMSLYIIFHTKYAFHYTYQNFCNTYHAFHHILNKYFIYAKCDNSCIFIITERSCCPCFRGYSNMAGIVKYVVFLSNVGVLNTYFWLPWILIWTVLRSRIAISFFVGCIA